MKFHQILLIFLVSIIIISCSNDDDANIPQQEEAILIGTWKRMNTEDQNGDITSDIETCNLTEFTAEDYTVTTYMDADCMDEFTVATLPYTRVENILYYGETTSGESVEIIALTDTTLKLKNVFSEPSEAEIYNIVTYSRQ